MADLPAAIAAAREASALYQSHNSDARGHVAAEALLDLLAALDAAQPVDGMAEITRAWNAGYSAAQMQAPPAAVAAMLDVSEVRDCLAQASHLIANSQAHAAQPLIGEALKLLAALSEQASPAAVQAWILRTGHGIGIHVGERPPVDCVGWKPLTAGDIKDAPPAAVAVPALEVFRIAGGDTECCPDPTADEALECLRDLRQCYTEALQAPPAAVPAGYALVPVEPTPEIIAAGWFGGEMHVALGHANAYRECEGDYARMLAAARKGE